MMESTPEREFGDSLVGILGSRLWDLGIQFVILIGLFRRGDGQGMLFDSSESRLVVYSFLSFVNRVVYLLPFLVTLVCIIIRN